jgi:hypothetical protein
MKGDRTMTRQEFEAIIKEVNEAKCCGVHYVEDECELFSKAKPKEVASGLYVDKHRWYEISTTVYMVGEWYLGVTGVTDLFSEQMGYDDCDVDTVAYEMEQSQSVTYVQRKEQEQ